MEFGSPPSGKPRTRQRGGGKSISDSNLASLGQKSQSSQSPSKKPQGTDKSGGRNPPSASPSKKAPSVKQSPGTPQFQKPEPVDISPADQERERWVDSRVKQTFSRLPIAANFRLIRQVGEGTFSSVFLAQRMGGRGNKIALKFIVPTSKSARIETEIKCLELCEGHPNIMQLYGAWRVEGEVILAMPYFSRCRFSDLLLTMDIEELKHYMANLLSALQHIHKLNIIHRDVKPGNFLYNRERRRYALVDFGLAHFYQRKSRAVEASNESKRRSEDAEQDGSAAKRSRPALAEVDNKLNTVSPTTRLLREMKASRRSPRKHNSPRKEDKDPATTPVSRKRTTLYLQDTPEAEMVAGRGIVNGREGVPIKGEKTKDTLTEKSVISPIKPQRPSTTEQMVQPKPLWRSPRKSNTNPFAHKTPEKKGTPPLPIATSTPGFSTLTITGSAILRGNPQLYRALSVPNQTPPMPPKTLARTPSFTMLEPGSYQPASQSSIPTDTTQGRTPLLRASVTSAVSGSAQTPTAPPARPPRTPPKPVKILEMPCRCMSKPRVCQLCLELSPMQAQRAGTPGFRPPEVLLKYAKQTTAVDIWAAGVMMICILSRSYPFFGAPDDATCLAEMCVLFGTKNMENAAIRYGRRLLTSSYSAGISLVDVCRLLASRRLTVGDDIDLPEVTVELKDAAGNTKQSNMPPPHIATDDAVNLLYHLLHLDHWNRYTAEEALCHPFLQGVHINT